MCQTNTAPRKMRAVIIISVILSSSTLLFAEPFYQQNGWPFEDIEFDHPIQSPINIISSDADRVKLPNLEFHRLNWNNVTVRVKNTGYTVELLIPDSSVAVPFICGGPLNSEYVLDNVHFHWGLDTFDGGEHELDGYRFAIEGHAVHFKREYGTIENAQEKDDGLAVIAFFGRASKEDNPHFTVLTDQIEKIIEPDSFVDVTGKSCLRWFSNLGQPNHYYTYPGSLTTPPYSENVVWIVYPKPVHISESQVDSFREIMSQNRTLIESNRRDIQDFNDRPLIFAA